MHNEVKLSQREYMCIIARYYSWITEHKVDEDNITKDDIDNFISYMSILNRFNTDIVKTALRQYFSFIDSELIKELGLMSTNFN